VAEAFRARSGYRWRALDLREPLDALRPRLDPVALAEGATLSLEDAAAHAQRGRGARGRPEHGWDALTPSEARVVELVAAGLSNQEIAGKLFVSLATVKSHLVHVFQKLEVRSRAELAVAVTRRGERA
jgi:DNA-binding NarL/FixJ family response regulator